MAYKFQIGAARMSGSLTQEGDFKVFDDSGAEKGKLTTAGALSASAGLEVGGTVKFDGVTDAALDVAADSFYFRDADGGMRRDSMADYASAIAGDGLAASSGVLTVGVDNSSIERDSDALRVKALGITDGMLAGSISNGKLSNSAVTYTAGLGLSGGGAVSLGGSTTFDLALSELADAAVASGDKFAFVDATDNSSKVETIDDMATFMAGNGLAAASAVLRVDLNELAGGAIASGDSFAFTDANDSNISKKESIDDLATLFAGDGLAAASAVLAVQVSGAVKIASDRVGISGSIAGDGLDFAGGADSISGLSVKVDGSSVELFSDALRVKAAGITNAMLAGGIQDDRLNQIITADKVAGSAVQLAGTTALENNTGLQLKPATAGDGLSMASQVLSVSVDGSSIETFSDALRVKAAGITNAMLAGSIQDDRLNQITTGDKVAGSAVQLAATTAFENSTGLRLKAATAGVGLSMASQVLALDLNELSAAAVDVANDSFAIIDANDSNGSRKESIADLVSAIAGGGLTATAGVLSVQLNDVSGHGNAAVTLAEGMNYGTADLTAARVWTLPAAPAVGDIVHVKAPASVGAYYIDITRAGSQTIDGAPSVRLESDGGAVSLMYVANDTWKIF